MRRTFSSAVFRRNYYRYRLVFDGLAGTGTGMLILLAEPLVDLVFDDRYGGVAPILQILALALILTGPMMPRSAFSAERRFRAMTYLSLLTTAVLWLGLAICVLVFDSLTAALLVVALHRLPEALVLTWSSYRRGWVSLPLELMPLVFLALGAGIGWGLDLIWDGLT